MFSFIALIIYWLIPTSSGVFKLTVPAGYNKEFPPLPSPQLDKRLIIKISLQFIDLLEINEVLGEMKLAVFYRVLWNETRVPAVPEDVHLLSLSPEIQSRLWRPDIVTENARSVERNGIHKPTIYQGVFPPQRQFFSTYIALAIGCAFEYESYPMDVQTCIVHMGTMGLTTEEVDLRWHDRLGFKMVRHEFLKFHDLFRLKVCEQMEAPERLSTFGLHPQKRLAIILQRNFKSAVVQVFLPSVFFILIAWLSVLVPPTMLRTRLLLNSTNLLTIISMFLSICKTESTRVPKVSYVTALNLWMFVCVAFCFSSVMLVILDIRLVVILTDPGRKLQSMRDLFLPRYTKKPGNEDEAEEDDDFADATDITPETSESHIADARLRARVARKRLEWMSRTAAFERVYLFAYPVLFLVFCTAFFGFFLWQRDAKLHRLTVASGGEGTMYPGCWCAVDDHSPGCMEEEDYPPG